MYARLKDTASKKHIFTQVTTKAVNETIFPSYIKDC